VTEGSPRPRLFLCHVNRDQPDNALAAELADRLDQGFEVFVDLRMTAGIPWESTIEDALEKADLVIALISDGALKSHMVGHEIRRAAKRLRSTGLPLILPVLIGDLRVEDLPYGLAGSLEGYQFAYWSRPADTALIVESANALQEGRSALPWSQRPRRRRHRATGLAAGAALAPFAFGLAAPALRSEVQLVAALDALDFEATAPAQFLESRAKVSRVTVEQISSVSSTAGLLPLQAAVDPRLTFKPAGPQGTLLFNTAAPLPAGTRVELQHGDVTGAWQVTIRTPNDAPLHFVVESAGPILVTGPPLAEPRELATGAVERVELEVRSPAALSLRLDAPAAVLTDQPIRALVLERRVEDIVAGAPHLRVTSGVLSGTLQRGLLTETLIEREPVELSDFAGSLGHLSLEPTSARLTAIGTATGRGRFMTWLYEAYGALGALGTLGASAFLGIFTWRVTR
jgi:TIR domain